eukprot:3922839-Prymnesium_polylepis.2
MRTIRCSTAASARMMRLASGERTCVMRGSSPFHVGPSMTPRACSFTSDPSLESFLTRVFMSEPMMVWPSASWLRASAADTGRRHSVSSLAMWDVIALSHSSASGVFEH